MAGWSTIEAGDARRLTVWYDGGCPICSAEIRLIRRFDRGNAIEFVDLRLPGDCPAEQAARLARFHAQPKGGPVVSGAAAFVSMWRVLPGFQILARLASPPPMLWALERGYLLFLRVRPALQAIVRRLSRERSQIFTM